MSAQQQKSARRVRGTPEAQQPDAGQRCSRIAMAAYFIAERRGFAPGHELDDWLAAEAEVDGNGLPSVLTSMTTRTNRDAS